MGASEFREVRWQASISWEFKATPTFYATAITRSSQFSCLFQGIPPISNIPRRPYCSRSTISFMRCLSFFSRFRIRVAKSTFSSFNSMFSHRRVPICFRKDSYWSAWNCWACSISTNFFSIPVRRDSSELTMSDFTLYLIAAIFLPRGVSTASRLSKINCLVSSSIKYYLCHLNNEKFKRKDDKLKLSRKLRN